ncbi:hypothetical protein FA13DRAFT_766295 [Coprinellus micaceus]|uniref:Uncharacterized protein n=1 Tax=Coprinellus micaceus TaxID=71717 RepID=A0A4Y7S848_COPMI|nr:hypothetical protein FA13DRAFT_766295 [Coprinellus micaceus]
MAGSEFLCAILLLATVYYPVNKWRRCLCTTLLSWSICSISIAVRLSTLEVRVPFHRILTLTTQSAVQDPSAFSALDTLHIQCNLLGELESEESRQSCIGLIKMFPEVKAVMVRGPTDFRQTRSVLAHPQAQPTRSSHDRSIQTAGA